MPPPFSIELPSRPSYGPVIVFDQAVLAAATDVTLLQLSELPASLGGLSTTDLVTHQDGGSTTRLHVFVVPVVLLCLLVHWLLQRTMFGRGVYALGGDSESARRAGFPVVRLQVAIYALVGLSALWQILPWFKSLSIGETRAEADHTRMHTHS